MSLSFSFSDDAAHGPVIASPVVGAQPLPLSASLADFEPMDFGWKVWNHSNQRYKSFRSLPLMTLESLKKTLNDNPNYYSPQVEGLFAVLTQRPLSNGSAPRKYGKVGLFAAHDAMNQGQVQNLNELFLNNPVKPFFDIDFKDRPELIDNDREQAQFLNSLIGHLSRHCGYSSNIADWSIQQTFHENKFSVHLVVNDNTHYANCKALKAHLIACGVDFARYGIDTHIYATGQLRALGSGKEWDQVDFKPLLLRGIRHDLVTFPQFAAGLVQYIPTTSRLIEVEEDVPAPRGQIVDMTLMQSEIATIVGALNEIYQQNLDPVADVTSKSYHEYMLVFDLDNLESCQCGKGRGAKIMADTRKCRQVLRIQRKNFCCRETTIGYTPISAQYLDQLAQLDFYMKHRLARLSTPIYDHPNPCYRGAGFFETSAEELCAKLGVEMPERWTYFHIPDTGNLVDANFFKFVLNDRPGHFTPTDPSFELTVSRLCAYMSLFACCIQQTNNWYIRTKKGIMKQKKASVQTELFGVCVYEEMKTKGRGEDKETIFIEKPFWKFFETKGDYLIAGISQGALDLTNREVMCLTPPKQVDVRKAMMKFLNLPDADKDCLRALWAVYLKMAVAYENPEDHQYSKDYIERWVTTVMFDTFKPAMMMLIFMSAGGGQGKSSLGNFICSFLGYELCTTGASANALLKDGFSGGTNNFINFDEFKDGTVVDELKEAITAPTVRVRYLYENPYLEPSRKIFYGTTNKRLVMAVNARGRERRFCIFHWLDVQQMESLENGTFFLYECKKCPVRLNRFREPMPCSHHGFVDHPSFMDRFHTMITNKPDAEDIYVNGPFFEHFVGMLYALYLEKKGNWKGSLQSEMPTTKATLECQTKVETAAGKYIDDCNARNFTWHPSQSPKERTIWVVEKTMANMTFEHMRSQAPKWLRYVTKQALYSDYVSWAQATNSTRVPENIFYDQLDELCRSRMGFSIVDSAKMVKCEKLIYSKEGGEMTPSFKNLNDPAFDACLLDLGEVPWVRKNLKKVSSAVVVGPVSPQEVRAEAPISLSSAARRPLNESTNTRQAVLSAREQAEERARYEEMQELQEQQRERAGLRSIWEEADACDGFSPIPRRRGREEDEEVDERLQDEEALMEDEEIERRFTKGSKFLRLEAGESDREDSGSGVMEDDEDGGINLSDFD